MFFTSAHSLIGMGNYAQGQKRRNSFLARLRLLYLDYCFQDHDICFQCECIHELLYCLQDVYFFFLAFLRRGLHNLEYEPNNHSHLKACFDYGQYSLLSEASL